MWQESEGGIYPSDPGPLEGSRDHEKAFSTVTLGRLVSLILRSAGSGCVHPDGSRSLKANFPREHCLEQPKVLARLSHEAYDLR